MPGVSVSLTTTKDPAPITRWVFLPGWCNSGRSFFAVLAERLAARYRVIRLDWRGHGDSGRPGADFGHDELADDAMAVIEAAGDERWFWLAD